MPPSTGSEAPVVGVWLAAKSMSFDALLAFLIEKMGPFSINL
jgi:hypothetical protein